MSNRIFQVGKHKVRHGDVHLKSEIAAFLGNTKAGIFYSDPPWGTGNIKFWNTLNKKMNNIDTDTGNYDVDLFLQTVLEYAVKYTDGFVVIEYGQRWTEQVIQRATEAGLIWCDTVETLYKGGGKELPLDVIVFHTSEKVTLDLSSIHHTIGYPTVKAVFTYLSTMRPLKYQIGMDLCCGMGYTAQACIDNGLTFFGNELNLARLTKTIARLKKDKNNG